MLFVNIESPLSDQETQIESDEMPVGPWLAL
jgi:hypothetical protein